MIMSEASGESNLTLHTIAENGLKSPKHTKADWLSLLGGASNYMGSSKLWEKIRVIPSPTPPFAGQPQCADGIDNDNPPDGKIDYPADPGCSSAYGDNDESDTSLQYSPADINQDGSINIQDIQIVVKVITGVLTNSRADVNGDGIKNIKDIQAIVRAIIGV